MNFYLLVAGFFCLGLVMERRFSESWTRFFLRAALTGAVWAISIVLLKGAV